MTPEQLKLADKIEAWSPEKWKPLTLIAHERRLAVAALRATPDARVKEALEQIAARKVIRYSDYLRCQVCEYKSVHPHTEERHAPNCARQVALAALSHQPGTGEADRLCDCCQPSDGAICRCERSNNPFWRGYSAGLKAPRHFPGQPPALDTATVEACIKAIGVYVASRDDLGRVHFVELSDAIRALAAKESPNG